MQPRAPGSRSDELKAFAHQLSMYVQRNAGTAQGTRWERHLAFSTPRVDDGHGRLSRIRGWQGTTAITFDGDGFRRHAGRVLTTDRPEDVDIAREVLRLGGFVIGVQHKSGEKTAEFPAGFEDALDAEEQQRFCLVGDADLATVLDRATSSLQGILGTIETGPSVAQ